MSDPGRNSIPDLPEAEAQEHRRGISVVWLLPIVAALISAWLVYTSFQSEGPVIEVTFERAAGIEPGKTAVKYRDLNVGEVTELRFSDDLKNVVVTIQLVVGAEGYLTESTRFWVVRPRIGKSGVSGIGTLLSGAYVGMDPGNGGDSERKFVGLEEPPGITSDAPGRLYQLTAKNLGSLSAGSPVSYRGIAVGRVFRYRLADDSNHVEIDIFVDAPYDSQVRANTRFWNASGIEVDMTAEGINVDINSVASLLSGGVAFETPPGAVDSDLAPEGAMFALHQKQAPIREEMATITVPYRMYFDRSVRGLTVGAPVEFRGIRVGTVTEVALNIDVSSRDIRIPVTFELEPDRIPPRQGRLSDSASTAERQTAATELIGNLVEKGLRARLKTGSLVTGKLFVDLDFYASAEPATVIMEGNIAVLPTVSGTLSDITVQINDLLSRLESVPLEEIGGNLARFTGGVERVVNDEAFQQTVPRLNDVIAKAELLLTSLTETSDQVRGELLEEVKATNRTLRVLLDYLQQHPEALLKGKASP
jgi:paraquat-inducible protein B